MVTLAQTLSLHYGGKEIVLFKRKYPLGIWETKSVMYGS